MYLDVGTACHFKTGNALITVYSRKDLLDDVIKINM